MDSSWCSNTECCMYFYFIRDCNNTFALWEKDRGGKMCIKCGRCLSETRDEPRFFSQATEDVGHSDENKWPTAAGEHGMCVFFNKCTCYVCCIHMWHMIVCWADAWCRDNSCQGIPTLNLWWWTHSFFRPLSWNQVQAALWNMRDNQRTGVLTEVCLIWAAWCLIRSRMRWRQGDDVVSNETTTMLLTINIKLPHLSLPVCVCEPSARACVCVFTWIQCLCVMQTGVTWQTGKELNELMSCIVIFQTVRWRTKGCAIYYLLIGM